jgi:branched-chain amino acid transport system ATP-binding protein
LVIDKSLKEIGKVADTATILQKGATVWTGPFADLTPAQTSQYLGV